MRTDLSVEGTWPGPLVLASGWFRARARPWNDVVTEPMIRLERGGAEFLRSITEHFADLGVATTYSPALYASSTRVWRRSGFADHETLQVMELSMNRGQAHQEPGGVRIEPRPNWPEIVEIDRLSFEGFWRMSALGLREAYTTNRNAVLLVTPPEGKPVGYAIVGAQWATVFLHRIAVRPEAAGQGLGTALATAAIDWGRRVGGRSMILNVRRANVAARHLYHGLGFIDTESPLCVLRHENIC